jgi:integrase
MAGYKFKSLLGSLICDFISQKQASGYPYQSSSRILRCFDVMAAEKFPGERLLTKEICGLWLKYKPGEHPNGLLRRITPVRQFGKYLRALGYNAYIIQGNIPAKPVKYEARIYTVAELQAFFKAVDHCPASPFSPTRKYVIPVIFRLLYCCGLRSSEARLLMKEDVELATGKITIRESKGWKARIIYMSEELRELCYEYDSIIESVLPCRTVFFPNKNGGCFNKGMLGCWFHEFWDKLPEAQKNTGNPARVHDFRHSYAVHRLNQWVRDGKDITSLYLYLSEYMGHCQYSDTDYYLSLVEAFYPEMEKRLSSLNDGILPEALHEEE